MYYPDEVEIDPTLPFVDPFAGMQSGVQARQKGFSTSLAVALQAFKTFGDKLSGSPEAIVEGVFRDLAVWAGEPRWAGSGFTRLVIELADLPGHPARLIARRHKARLERCFGELLERSGVRHADELARAIWLLSEGAISLILVHGDQGYSAAASGAAITLVRSHMQKHHVSSHRSDVS